MIFLLHVIMLIRPLNALIVFAALIVVRLVLQSEYATLNLTPHITQTDYLLMIVTGMLILGSGNVVNDIIDQEIDRINKPGKAIIPEKVTSLQAWILYSMMNLAAVLLSAYLAARYGVLQYLSLPVGAILLLYVYSRYLKKRFFWGNFAIAFLCASLPLAGFLVESSNVELIRSNDPDVYRLIAYQVICMMSFSFILVLNRELVKDCEDVDGDSRVGADTMPIRLGNEYCRKIMLGYFILYALVFSTLNYQRYLLQPGSLLMIATVVFLVVYAFGIIYAWRKYEGKKFYSVMSALIKLYLIIGLLFMLI